MTAVKSTKSQALLKKIGVRTTNLQVHSELCDATSPSAKSAPRPPQHLWNSLTSALSAGRTIAHEHKRAYQSRRNLWQEAVQSLEPKDRPEVQGEDEEYKHFNPEPLQRAVEDKLDEVRGKEWFFTNSKGEKILIRSIFSKIARWLEKFRAVGDNIVQYDPGHAALPWIAIRILIQVTISDVQSYGSMIDGIERCAGIVTRFAEVEKIHLQGNSILKRQLGDSLVVLYAALLRYLAKAQAYFGASTTKRILTGGLQAPSIGIHKYTDDLIKAEDEALKASYLVAEEDQKRLLEGLSVNVNRLVEGKVTPKFSDEERQTQVAKWLNASFTDSTYIDSQNLRYEGTCQWVFQRKIFQEWLGALKTRDRAQILWIHAGPGFGKTVLCAHIVDYLIENKLGPVSYFFCVSDDQTRREPYAILRSWIAQMIRGNALAFEIAYENYRRSSDRSPVDAELWPLFRSIASKVKCTLVVDGFDECTAINKASRFHTTDGKSSFMRSLVAELGQTRTAVVFVSRNTEDIASTLSLLSPTTTPALYECPISAKDNQDDISMWSASIVATDLSNKKPALQDEIAKSAAEKADGMFLWLHLLRQQLKPGDNAKSLRKRISEMPSGLDQAYQRDLNMILSLPEYERQRALSILRWVAFSVGPLTVRELAEALALSDCESEDTYPAEDLPDDWEERFVDETYVHDHIRRPCGSLVELRKHKANQPICLQTVHFVHFSVKEFLLRSETSWNPEPTLQKLYFNDISSENNRLARLCLQYLCYDVFGDPDELVKEDKIRIYPFLFYAAKSWYLHATYHEKDISTDIMSYLEKLFDPATSNWRLWSQIYEGELQVGSDEDLDKDFDDGSDIAETVSVAGTEKTVRTDEKEGLNLQLTDHKSWEVKTAAAEATIPASTDPIEEDENLLRVATHVTENSAVTIGASPVYYAALLGLSRIVKVLIDQGLDCKASGGRLGFPLQAAAAKNHLVIVEYLLSVGADINQRGGKYGSAIGAAAALNHPEMFNSLLHHGADPFCAGSIDGETQPFVLACEANAVGIAEEIFKLGDCSAHMPMALYHAIKQGNLQVAKFLLDHGADPNGKKMEKPLLSLAIVYAYSERSNSFFDSSTSDSRRIVRCLLGDKADVNLTDDLGSTPLHYAADASDVETIKLLLNYKCDIKAADHNGLTALHRTACYGSVEGARLLVAAGANINALDSRSFTVLDYAVINDSSDFVKYTLELGADTTHMDMEGLTVLEYSLKEQRQKILEMLINHDVIHAVSIARRSAADAVPVSPHPGAPYRETSRRLQKLILQGHESEVIKAMDELHIDQQKPVLNSLVLAIACSGSDDLMRQVLRKGGNPNARNVNARSALHLASYRGLETMAITLLKHGADLHSSDLASLTPLEFAIKGGHLELAKTLVSRGAFINFTCEELPPATPLHRSAANMNITELKKLLDGNWTGSREYQSWQRGMKEDDSIVIDLVPALSSNGTHFGGLQETPTWASEGVDLTEPSVIGQVLIDEEDQIALKWINCYPHHGWLYSGVLDRKEGTITGYWGSNDRRPHGTFELRKTDQPADSHASSPSLPQDAVLSRHNSLKGALDIQDLERLET